MNEAELIQALKEIRGYCAYRKNCIGCKYRVLVAITTSEYTGYCVFDKPVDEWPIESIKEDK